MINQFAEQLKELLTTQFAASELVKSCIRALDSDFQLRSSDSVQTEQIRKIYEARSRINKLKGNSVIGYAELIPNLNSESAEAIRLHLIKTSNSQYVVFTDLSLKRVIGVLALKSDTYEIKGDVR
jgi:hypothetical protein